VITIGGRSVVAACRIREASGGHTRVVCLGRPWAPLHWFDLVVTTPQYRLPGRPNVLQNALPLNHAPTVDDSVTARAWIARLASLPRPHIAVLAGGNNGTYVFDRPAARDLAARVSAMARSLGGSLLLATSPRTSSSAAGALMEHVTAPHVGYVWSTSGRDQNPYALFLDRAQHIVVTSDSASMLADACSTRARVHLYDLPESRRTRLLNRMSRQRSRLGPWREALTARGLWVPRKDLTRIHERLIARGRIARLGEDPQPVANVSDLDMTLQRIRTLMDDRPVGSAVAVARAS
jgi:mitochondrial fission protein ELM1